MALRSCSTRARLLWPSPIPGFRWRGAPRRPRRGATTPAGSASLTSTCSPRRRSKRASGVPGSREALLLSPQHEYAHLVVGANNPYLPPPFSLSTFRRYVRWAWLCEGAATWLSGQAPLLRAAIVRRLREGGRPAFPPEARDAMLLGGTVFGLLEEQQGTRAAAALATSDLERGPRSVLVDAFGRQLTGVESDWRELLAGMSAS